MDALAVLVRLARQAVDEERPALLAIDQAIAAAHDRLISLRETAERERRTPCTLTDGDLRLAAYQGRVLAQERRLHAELRRLESERAAQARRLAERHLELRRLEILAERRAKRARAERLRREQRALDELVLMRQQHRSRR